MSAGTAADHHGSAVRLRCSSVPSTIATPVSSSAASRSNSVNEVADHADTRS